MGWVGTLLCYGRLDRTYLVKPQGPRGRRVKAPSAWCEAPRSPGAPASHWRRHPHRTGITEEYKIGQVRFGLAYRGLRTNVAKCIQGQLFLYIISSKIYG